MKQYTYITPTRTYSPTIIYRGRCTPFIFPDNH